MRYNNHHFGDFSSHFVSQKEMVISVKNHAKNNKDACFSPLLPKATETDAI
jgi:hypothetical protein